MAKINRNMSDEEYEGAIKTIFDSVDANSDGVLQLDEFKNFMIEVAKQAGEA